MPALLSEYRFQVLNPATPGTQYGTVRAAYFAEDGAYTLFKDAGHANVLALRSDYVVSIERVVRDSGD